LGLGGFSIAAQLAFAEDRDAQRALGDKVSVRAHCAHLADAVVAAKAEAGQALAAIGGVDGLVGEHLVLLILVVLAVLIGDSAYLFRGLRGQFAIRSGVSEHDLLAWVDADLAFEQDQVLFLRVFGLDQGLLLGLKLDPRPQLIEISSGSGLVRVVSVAELHLVGRLQGLGVVHLAGVGDGMKVGCGYLLHHLAARRHFGEMGGLLTCAGSLKTGNHGAGEEHLAEVDLPFGELVAGDEGEPSGRHASGKERAEFFESFGAKTERDQVLLVDAGIASEGDGGQELLESFFLFPLDIFFAVLGFLQAEVVFKAAAYSFVQREPEGFIAG
jgi:hypothetical protein